MIRLGNAKLCTASNCILVSIVNFIHLLCSMCWTGQELVLLCRVWSRLWARRCGLSWPVQWLKIITQWVRRLEGWPNTVARLAGAGEEWPCWSDYVQYLMDGPNHASWIEPTTETTPYVSIVSIFVYQLIEAGRGKCCVESGTVCVW